MEFTVVEGMQSMPIGIVQAFAISKTKCAVCTEQRVIDREALSKLFKIIAVSTRLCIRDLLPENKNRGQL